MIKFYYNAAPNPMKVALLLEELGTPYQPVPVDTRKGEQFSAEYLAVNPNGKVPAIVDGETIVFDSNAILLYLADKAGRFVPAEKDSAARGRMLSWLMFVASGIGPFSGQSVHFRHAAPEPKAYALNRYDFEANRHWKLIDDQLARNDYMLGAAYGIVDMAVWGWARMVPHVLGDDSLLDATAPRQAPAGRRQRAAGRRSASEKLRTSHAFKAEMDAEARRHMFPQNERLAS